MRIESSITSLSWIPLGAVEGFNRLSFGLRVAHYDPPPPEVLEDLDELEATDRFRFANRLQAWIEVEDGRVVDAGQAGGGRSNVTKVGYGAANIAFAPLALRDLRPEPEIGPTWARFVQTTGGRTGFPAPRRVRHEPYVKIAGPVARPPRPDHPCRRDCREPAGRRQLFPRHWVYDHLVGWSPRVGLSTHTWWRRRSAPTPPGCRGLGPDRGRGRARL